MLKTYSFGSGGRPLLIAHGLFGSARNWGVLAKRMSTARQVVTVDMRNHGASPRSNDHSYQSLAHDLAEVVNTLGGAVDVLGHSMGGKAAMALALLQPDMVARLVVADIAPVRYSHTQAHLIAAMQAVDPAGLNLRSEADAMLSASVDDPGVRAFLLQSLDLKSDPPRWNLNLSALDEEMDKIIGWPALEGQYTGPVLMLSGAMSDYVDRSHRPVIKEYFPAARFAKIPGAGHWLHADKPREFQAAVETFLT